MAQVIKIGDMWYSDFRRDGKRIKRALSPYRDKAELMLKDLIKMRESQKDGTPLKDISWFLFREKVLIWYKENRKPNTYQAMVVMFETFERVGRAITHLVQVSPEYMDDFLVKCKAKKLRVETAMSHLSLLKTAIKWAEARSLIPTRNWTLIKITRYAPRVEYFDYAELDKVIAAAKGHWKTAAMLMAYAGLRSGEVRHLEWKDIDFKNRYIHIRAKTVQDADGKMIEWAPKESEPGKPRNRVVDMITRLEKHLQSLPRRTGFVVGDENGDLLRLNTYRRFFGRMTKKVKFKVYAHKFRHTYASFMASAGVDLRRIAELMGHKDQRSTEIYSHLMPHARRTAVDQMEASLPPVGPRFEILGNEGNQAVNA